MRAAHTCRSLGGLSLALVVALWPPAVRAQGLEPLSLANGRIVISGDLAASVAPDDLGFFNYSDYEHSTLREVRVGLATEVRISRQVSVLGELRTGNLSALRPFSLFLRVEPWQGRNLNIQVGRIPPTFGAYTRRAYSRDNPLIGYPMAYQYLTSLRPDAAPVSVDDLLRMRGRGWLSGFSAGSATLGRGVPLVTVFSRDTGAQIATGWRALELSASVTTGSPANPQLDDGNSGATVSARAAIRPAPGIALGASWAGGAFLRKTLTDLGGAAAGSGGQRVGGLDLELAGGRWLARADLVVSDWRMPLLGAPALTNPLRAVATAVEIRRTLAPGLYVAGRAEHLSFSSVTTSTVKTGPRVVSWDAPVSRLEVGGGYSILRNVGVRASVQFNRRDGGRVRESMLPAAQLMFWF